MLPVPFLEASFVKRWLHALPSSSNRQIDYVFAVLQWVRLSQVPLKR